MPTLSREKAGTTVYCRCKRGHSVSHYDIEIANQRWNELNPSGAFGMPFIVGDRVRLKGSGNTNPGCNQTISRRVIWIRKIVQGYLMQADEGEYCPQCKRYFDEATPLLGLSSDDFEKA